MTFLQFISACGCCIGKSLVFELIGTTPFFLEKIEINRGFETTYRLYNDSKSIVINDIKASWYRRGRLNILLASHKITEDKQLNAAMDKHLNNEKQILESFFIIWLTRNHISARLALAA